MIPDFAIVMLSNEPPSASKCSSPIVVIIDDASSEALIIFVASRAPPRPACHIKHKRRKCEELLQVHLSGKWKSAWLEIQTHEICEWQLVQMVRKLILRSKTTHSLSNTRLQSWENIATKTSNTEEKIYDLNDCNVNILLSK